MCSGALRHRLQCVTVSLHLIEVALFIFIFCRPTCTKLFFALKAHEFSGAWCERRHPGPACTRSVICHLSMFTMTWIYVLPGHNLEFLLFSVVSGLAASLPTLLISTSTSAAERKDQLNAVKMSVYLLCKLTETLEGDSHRQNIITAPGKVNFYQTWNRIPK